MPTNTPSPAEQVRAIADQICGKRTNGGYVCGLEPDHVCVCVPLDTPSLCRCGVVANTSHYCSALDHAWVGKR